jgi:hypothetical protein
MFQFSPLGARTGGRAHGALWDGLLGWLMRDPRFENVQLEPLGRCIAGLPSRVEARMLPEAASGMLKLEVSSLDKTRVVEVEAPRPPGATTVELTLPPLADGAYTAKLALGGGVATRLDFACEAGGDEWADSRPDPQRLRSLADATGGTFAYADEVSSIPWPKPTVLTVDQTAQPLAPPWAWSCLAAGLLGAHWVLRRRSGLS